MGYFADDLDLSTLAWNVENRSASWVVSSRRGNNIVIPGKDGSKFVKKPLSERTEVWDMWVQGSEQDGAMPSNLTEKVLCRDNIGKLAALFGSGRQVELARAEGNVAYGRTNLLPNPSLEKFGGREVVRENQINNPSGEYSSGDFEVRHNYAPNPNMTDARKLEAFRTNLAINPRMVVGDKETVRRTNILPNPSLEAALAPWQGNADTDAKRSQRVNPGWPSSGRWSLYGSSISGTGGIVLNSASFPVVTGTVYAVRSDFRSVSADGLTRTVRARIRWKKKSGEPCLVPTSDITLASVDSTVQTISGTVTAPATAAFAVLSLQTTTSQLTDKIYYDRILVEDNATADAATPYFDGDSDEVDGMRFRWKDNSGGSASEGYTVRPLGWISNTRKFFGLTTLRSRYGPTSAVVKSLAALTSGEMIAQQSFRDSTVIEDNIVFSMGFSFQLRKDITTVKGVKARVICYDRDGADLGAAHNAGTSVAMTDVSTAGVNGEWIDVAMDNLETRPRTAAVGLYLMTSEAWATGDGVYIDGILLEAEASLGSYFDGSTRDEEVFSYEWQGDPQESPSDKVGYKVQRWNANGLKQYRYKDPDLEDYGLRMQATKTAVVSPTLEGDPHDIVDGRIFYLSLRVKSPTAIGQFQAGYSLDRGVNWTYGTGSALTSSNQRIGVQIPALTTEEINRLKIGGRYNATLAVDEAVDVTGVQLEQGAGSTPYFDGDSGKRFKWKNERYNSISIALGYKANGWSGHGPGRPSVERVRQGNGTTFGVKFTAKYAGNFGWSTGQDGVDDDLIYSHGADYYSSATGTIRAGISYYGKNGNLISETFTDTACTANVWVRAAHVGSTIPVNAVTAAPWGEFRGGAAGATLIVDRAVFGFGGITTFADGDNGGGWVWKGDRYVSESLQFNVIPDNWLTDNGTFARSTTPAAGVTNRSYCGLYTVVSGTGPWRVRALHDETKNESRFFRLRLGNQVVLAADVRTSIASQIRIGFVPRRWTGWGWASTTSPIINTAWTNLAANTNVRATIADYPNGNTGDATHFYVVIEMRGSTGGAPAAGATMSIDSVLLSYESITDISYQDGEQVNVRWKGGVDNSESKRVGPARRCMAEVRSGIDMSSVNARMARFPVEFVIPAGCWEDTRDQTETYTIGRPGSIITLDHLLGNEVDIVDAVIKMNGGYSDIRLEDLGSGAYIDLNFHMEDDETAIIDNPKNTVTNKRGRSLISDTRHRGSAYLLPLSNPAGENAPRIRVTGKSLGRGALLTVTARRKYHVA